MSQPSKLPPFLADEVLRRVLRVARFDGMSVLVIAGAFALICAAFRDVGSTATGILIAGAGAVELHGVGLLRNGERRGTTWLVSSQVGLLIMILGYVAWRFLHVDIAPLRQAAGQGMTDDLRAKIAATGMTLDDFLRLFYTMLYSAVGAATLLYQGGMIVYYLRRRRAVEAALSER